MEMCREKRAKSNAKSRVEAAMNLINGITIGEAGLP